MKLSADIVYDGLYGRFRMEMSGPKVTELRLGRPVFFDGAVDELRKDHLYIARTERLPRRAVIQEERFLNKAKNKGTLA